MNTLPILFKKQIGVQKITGRGVPVGEGLVVSSSAGVMDSYQIYRLRDGIPLPWHFSEVDVAKEVAKIVDELYKDFFCIWSEYPDIDIFGWCKYTVPNGIQIYEMFKALEGRVSNKQDIALAYKQAKSKVNYWTRNMKWK